LHDRLAETDACELIEKLTAHALRVFAQYGLGGKDATIPGVGKSAEDFVLDVLTEYLTGKLKTKDLPYLYTALRHKIIDNLRAASHRTDADQHATEQEQPDSGDLPHRREPRAGTPPPDDVLCEQDFKSRVRACVTGEPKLRDLVEAVFDLDLVTPREIAEALNVPVTEIYAKKKQLKRRLLAVGIPEVPLEK
jgi:DNA-directed RNA polymerase specialized sigma24 family protein